MTAPLFASARGAGRESVVLLHGFGASHRVWDGIAAALAGEVGTLAYDLPGHGQSLDVPTEGRPREAAQAVLADLAARGLTRVHLAGHSMGGAVATLAALAEPGRIASLTLLAPGGFGPEINGPLLRRYALAADAAELTACRAAMAGPGAEMPAASSTLEMRRRPGQLEKLAEIVTLITRDGRQGVIPAAMLASLAMPVTVLWGEQDPVLPVSQTDGLPPHFGVRRLPGAGHMLIEEAPATVAHAIRASVRRAAP